MYAKTGSTKRQRYANEYDNETKSLSTMTNYTKKVKVLKE